MGTEMETSGNRTALGVTSDIAQQVGARLRKARESIGRTTSALSAKIKVREHYLVAIEDGEWNELPPGLNGRGLVRIYARELSVSVPELDQAANQTVMPAEQVAQAPYQIAQSKKESHASADRDIPVVRVNTVDPTNFQASAARTPEPVGRTSTLASAQRSQRNGIDAVTPNSRPAPTHTTHTTHTTHHRLIESTPEEEPLDVVTPDVASILGISLETIDPQPVTQKPALVANEARMVKGASVESRRETVAPPAATESIKNPVESVMAAVAEPVLAQMEPVAQPVAEPAPAVAIPAFDASTLELEPVVQVVADPVPVAVEPAAAVSVETVAQAAEPTTPSAVQPVVASAEPVDVETQKMHVEPVAVPAPAHVETLPEAVQVSAVGAETVAESGADSSGASAAEAYLKSHARTAPSSMPPTDEETKSGSSKGFTIAVSVLAACVLVLIAGRLMTSETPAPSTSETKTAETVAADSAANAGTETAKQDTAAAPATAESANAPETSSNAAEPQPQNQPASAVQQTEAVPAAVPEKADEKLATANTSPQNVKAESASAEVPATQQTAAAATESAPANKTEASGATTAVLTLSESIEIQVTADGQRIYSGRHEAGKVNIKFNKRAEIFVQDGSKARLKYAGWDHGALGQQGRKRRIVLNATAFSSERP